MDAVVKEPRPEKVAIVAEIRERLTSSQAAVITEYRGLDVAAMATLRGRLRPAGVRYTIYKNTLARIAVREAGLDDLLPMLEGPTAIAFVDGDAVVAAKALTDFAGENDHLVLKGGVLGTRILTSGDVRDLAKVEPREVLLAKLAGAFQAPLVKAAGLMQAFTRNTAYAVQALIDQRVAGGEALPTADVAAEEAPAADVVVEEPTADVVVDEPTADAPAAEEPTADVAADEPAAEEPTADVAAEEAAADVPAAGADD